jgi:sterol 24-C-methyltransferase
MPSSDEIPLINVNESLQSYYASLESRIGYRLMLGGTRHFGYYERDTYWPFPINGALRAMEDHLFNTLGLTQGAQVLDAGCGVAHVAIHMAEKGLFVQGIDVIDHHIVKAQRNIEAQGLKAAVKVRKIDYHHLDAFSAASFDGIYTMETFVHATDPEGVLQEFLRVLKPGGRIALYEYDHRDLSTVSKDLRISMDKVNEYAAMPTNTRFDEGVLETMLKEAGFEDIMLEDLSVNIRPMLRLFFIIAIIPYLFIRLLGLEAWFVNTVAGVQGYRGRYIWRYVAVSARKPIGGKGNINLGRDRKQRE